MSGPSPRVRRIGLTSTSSYAGKLGSAFGARLQQLFGLEGIPATLEELGDLVRERWSKNLREQWLSAYFRKIYSGSEIFGSVEYETGHKVETTDGRSAYAACALDALIEGFFLPIEICSVCHHCGQPIRMQMSKGTILKAEPESVVVWLGASREGSCTCETDACPYINFFVSQEHVADWKERNPDELGITLTLSQSVALAKKGWWEPISSVASESNEPRV